MAQRVQQPESPPSAGIALRVLPPGMYAGRARVLVERSLLVNSRIWLSFVSGFFEPLLYLLSLGVGFGRLVPEMPGPDGRPLSYVAFVAPALLAASAMNGAVYDATFNVFFKFRYAKLYDAMLATRSGRWTSRSARSPGHCCAAACTRSASSGCCSAWAWSRRRGRC